MVRRLRAETTATMESTADRLRMGTKTDLGRLLCWQRRSEL